MKKNVVSDALSVGQKRFYSKALRSLILFSLILPLLLKVLVDIPAVAIDYVCNSYAPFYPTLTTVGLVITQVVAVLADILRAGFIGCVLCVLLYVIDKNVGRVRVGSCLAVVLLSPALISGLGLYLNYLCVTVGLSRQTVYEFEAQMPEIRTAMVVELVLYAVLVVGAVLCLLLRGSRPSREEKLMQNDGDKGFFPCAHLFGTVAIAIGFSGLLSLVEKVLETVVELQTYNVTESFEGIISHLVLPYLYLALSLFAMLCFAAIMYRRIDKKWISLATEDEA
ncbi:MAG: hypothetical protein E7599_03670 [Ruminococcaceae bacterium]|nr:hypothetical protein [Oscillospiraceae bacterium]